MPSKTEEYLALMMKPGGDAVQLCCRCPCWRRRSRSFAVDPHIGQVDVIHDFGNDVFSSF